jgi:hypothetical protein
MAEENKLVRIDGVPETEPKTRRAFVRTAAQVAVTAPAVAVLLGGTPASAQQLTLYQATQHHVLDDFTFGNTREDLENNTNTATQDDIFEGL